jgi:hypothetical protein
MKCSIVWFHCFCLECLYQNLESLIIFTKVTLLFVINYTSNGIMFLPYLIQNFYDFLRLVTCICIIICMVILYASRHSISTTCFVWHAATIRYIHTVSMCSELHSSCGSSWLLDFLSVMVWISIKITYNEIGGQVFVLWSVSSLILCCFSECLLDEET